MSAQGPGMTAERATSSAAPSRTHNTAQSASLDSANKGMYEPIHVTQTFSLTIRAGLGDISPDPGD